MKKETTYFMPYETADDIKQANILRQNLYDKFNSVQVYPNGLYEVRIVADDEISPLSCDNCAGMTTLEKETCKHPSYSLIK